jgi:hypothetical protein
VNVEVVKVMSTIIGEVLCRLEKVLRKTSHLATILAIYSSYAHHKHPIVRTNYLINLSIILSMPDRPLPDQWKQTLSQLVL